MIGDLAFHLGTHETSWLGLTQGDVDDEMLWPQWDGPTWFVSHRRLADRKRLPRARAGWALDSGGFSELQMFGEWRTTAAEYCDAVARYDQEIGGLGWAAPQDWMAEPIIRTGGRAGPVKFVGTDLSVEEHQRRTVANYVELRYIWSRYSDDSCPFIPVLQGWTLDDYLRCVDLYARAGIDLAEDRENFEEPLVGLGSVCRRQNTAEIAQIVGRLGRELGLAMHGFGVKSAGLVRYGHLLSSADSMAWSYGARREQALPGCKHKNCASCWRYALAWRRRLLDRLGTPDDGDQMALWGDVA